MTTIADQISGSSSGGAWEHHSGYLHQSIDATAPKTPRTGGEINFRVCSITLVHRMYISISSHFHALPLGLPKKRKQKKTSELESEIWTNIIQAWFTLVRYAQAQAQMLGIRTRRNGLVRGWLILRVRIPGVCACACAYLTSGLLQLNLIWFTIL